MEKKILKLNRNFYSNNLNIIVAFDKKRGIGFDNKLPWPKLKKDMKFFKNKTKGNIIIMGRKTWESIGCVPLKDRTNIIITSNINKINIKNYKDCHVYNSIDICLKNLKLSKRLIFIIGGHTLYNQTIDIVNNIYVTYIDSKFKSNIFFPNISDKFYIDSYDDEIEENKIKYRFLLYKRKKINKLYPNYFSTDLNYGEKAYLNLLMHTLHNGIENKDRTGVGTINTIGNTMKFNLMEGFPLLTTKKIYWKGIVEELFWFLRGETDAKILNKKNVKIWNGNSSREFLDKLGFKNREIGDCGPIYGHNFRHYGAKYVDCKQNYNGKGFDQIKYVINEIKNNPNSRRILINLWNPTQLNEVVLPPCHVLYQFRVIKNKYLTCLLTQRSGDLCLGVPFNIASASLLTYIIAKLTNKIPYELVHFIGDTHIYLNHIDGAKVQIKRKPYAFPALEINDSIIDKKIEEFSIKDLKLINYNHHSAIKLDMAC